MADNWDIFPSNIGEMLGPIERKSFTFNYRRFEVWQGGACIFSGNSNGQIIAQVTSGQLNVSVDDASINNHMKKTFFFWGNFNKQ